MARHDRAAPVRPGLQLAATAVVVLAAAVGAAGAGLSPATVRDAVGDGGPLAVLAFVGLYAALTVAMFPGSVLTLAAGALFGALAGAALTVVAATAGATVAFLIGRRLSRRSVEAIAGSRLRTLDRRLADSGFAAMLVLRLVPLVPFNVLNYAAGATSVSLRQYAAGTAVGIVPGSLAFAVAGAAASEPRSPLLPAALAALAALIGGGALVARRLRSREGAVSPAPATACHERAR